MEIGGHYDEVFSYHEFMKYAEMNYKAGGNVIQIFMGDRSLTTLTKKFRPTPEETKLIKTFLKKKKTKLFIHGNLRVNLAAPLHPRFLWNQENVIFDMNWGYKLGAKGVIVHLGTRTLQGKQQPEKDAYQNMAKSIQYILDQSPKSIKLIIEVNAGQTNKIGRTVPELRRIYQSLSKEDQKRVGFCLDTAHLFTAGYRMDTVDGVKAYFQEFDQEIGIKKILVTHLNDSAAEYDSRVDRHESLGEGFIYHGNQLPLRTVAQLLKKHRIPTILETRDPRKYQKEIQLVRKLAASKPLKGGSSGGTTEIIPIFRKMELLHTLLGNQFQARAYKNSVAIIKAYLLKEDRTALTADDLPKLSQIEGIGQETIEKIREIMQTGKLKRMSELLQAVPYTEKQIDTMLELQGVMGIGPKLAVKFVQQGVKSIADLKKPVRKLSQMQQLGVKYYRNLQVPIPRKEMESWRDLLVKAAAQVDPTAKGTLAGSYRLGKKESGDIDLILMVKEIRTETDLKKDAGKTMDRIVKHLVQKGILLDWLPLGDNEIMAFVRKNGTVRHLDLKLIPRESLPFYLLYFGSGERFSRKIRSLAKKKGYKLSQWGLFKGRRSVPVKNEREIFQKLGIPYVAPEDRLF